MRILVTSALPYANGDIHLGHLAGCYLSADIYTRYQRLKGEDIIHICGTDEHGVPSLLKAEAEGVSPKEIVDYYYKRIKESFEGLGIEFDNFSRTTLPLHYKLAQDFFLRIYKKGYIFPKTVTRFYCPNCKRFLPDRYIEGRCPHCGNPEARGDQCEVCGRWLEPESLIEPTCKICGGTPVPKSTKHWFFDLPKFQDRLKEWLSAKNWKPNVLEFCEGWFSEGLEPRAITRDLNWGVPVPLEEAKGKVLYVWFEALIGYISSTIEWAEKMNRPEKWKDYWLDPKTKLVHFIGKDNIVFHAIVWPAMLMAYGEFILPSEIPANEFLNLESRPLSTSRNWAIWLPEYLSEFEPDPLRYALASNLPENRDVDFTWRDFQARNNNELADILGNFVNRVLLFSKKYYSGRIPEPKSYTEDDRKLLSLINTVVEEVGRSIERFEIKNGIKEIMRLVSEGNRYFDYQRPWSTRIEEPERCKATISTCFKLISSLEILLKPYLPFTSLKIKSMLGLGNRRWEEAKNPTLPPEIRNIEILFSKIEEERIKLQIAKLKGGKMEITIDDFKKLDIRIGKVTKAERVEGTEKLILLEVDIGKERRTLVAGIAKSYKPQELLGKNIVLLVNLKPTKIRGIESQGMLLAAVDGENISLLTTDKEVSPGSEVS